MKVRILLGVLTYGGSGRLVVRRVVPEAKHFVVIGGAMAATPVDLLRERRQALQPIPVGRDSWHRVVEWCAGTRPLISKHFAEHLTDFDEARKVEWKLLVGVIGEDPPSRDAMKNKQENDDCARRGKANLTALLDAILRLATLDSLPRQVRSLAPTGGNGVTTPTNNKVFIVHGHDEGMQQAVARVLGILGLDPIILNEKENEGKTIIEKFEKHSDVSFAVILLSPDDMGYSANAGAKAATPRARQNVVLELGYFVGKLGRGRVAALKKGNDLEIPSDISGVVYMPYDGGSGWKLELCRELRAAGYEVDANKL